MINLFGKVNIRDTIEENRRRSGAFSVSLKHLICKKDYYKHFFDSNNETNSFPYIFFIK